MICYDRYNNESDLDQTVLQGYGNTDFQYFTHYRTLGFKIRFLQDNTFPFNNDYQRNNNADCLRYGSTKRCSGRTETKNSHEEIVQTNVGGTGNGDKIHRAFTVGLLLSPIPRKMELMILYAVINGIPMKHIVRYATVPFTASSGVDIAETIGPTSASKVAISVMDNAINSVMVFPTSFAACLRSPAPMA